MAGAFVCGALNLLSLVVDHYDRRNNARHYRFFAQCMRLTGWLLLFAALSFNVLVEIKASR
jgi:hypothetical protein